MSKDINDRLIKIEKSLRLLFEMINNHSVPNNCYVNAWHVHDEYKELVKLIYENDEKAIEEG